MSPTYHPPDWQERQGWSTGDKLKCAIIPVGVGLVTLAMWVMWKLWG